MADQKPKEFVRCKRNSHIPGNVFEKIMKGELPAQKVYEDDTMVAIKDINPQAPVHILCVPKVKYYSFEEFTDALPAEEVGNFFKKVRKVAVETGCGDEGFRIVMNHGMFAEQIVPHFHVHILGGRVLGQMTTVPDHQSDTHFQRTPVNSSNQLHDSKGNLAKH